jgi:hypothetical protein
MARIRATVKADSQQGELVERLLAAACEAMAKATANHAAEWLPAGLEATDGSITVEGKLCAARITPELRAKYDALPTTSTSVERLHAFGRGCDAQAGMQRADTRAGVCLGRYNGQAEWLRSKSTAELRKLLNVSRQAARALLRTTLKAQRAEAGRAKQAERETKLGSKRARRAAKAAEKARVAQVMLATMYSQLKTMAIPDLQDQLRAFKLRGETQLKFTVTQKNRVAYCTQLQALLLEAHGPSANDLEGDDSGCDGDGVVRKVRQREGRDATEGNKKRKADGWCEIAGYWWQPAKETFMPERLLDKKVETEKQGKVRACPPCPRNRHPRNRPPSSQLPALLNRCSHLADVSLFSLPASCAGEE